MTKERSAYSILGLRPGAGRAEVNQAYRRLMKRHHPDRPGGNAAFAAEINLAYGVLRRRLGEPVRVPVPVPARRRRLRFRQVAWLLVPAFIGVSVALQGQDIRRAVIDPASLLSSRPNQAVESGNLAAPDSGFSSFDEPVQPQIVHKAIAQAVRFHSAGDLAAASTFSSDCQKSLRREPNLSWFDACAAFDEAMLTLAAGADSESTPFNEPAVITRELAAVRLVSNDSLGADSHLHQIRSQVDFEILPMLDSAAALRP